MQNRLSKLPVFATIHILIQYNVATGFQKIIRLCSKQFMLFLFPNIWGTLKMSALRNDQIHSNVGCCRRIV